MLLLYLPIFKTIHLLCAFIWITFLALNLLINQQWIQAILTLSMLLTIIFGTINACVFGWEILQQTWFINKIASLIILICITIHSLYYSQQNGQILILITYILIFIIIYSVILK